MDIKRKLVTTFESIQFESVTALTLLEVFNIHLHSVALYYFQIELTIITTIQGTRYELSFLFFYRLLYGSSRQHA